MKFDSTKINYISNIENTTHKKEKSQIKKIYNYGLALLKCYLAFLVIISHNFSPRTTKNKVIIYIYANRRFAVPCFFIISFILMSKNLLSLNLKIIIKRIIRLLIPYIIWPIIILIINHIYNKIYNTKLPDTFEDLKIQLIWGSRYIHQFWFLWALISFTLFFVIIILIFKDNSMFMLQIIGLLFYFAQYSGYHYNKVFLKYPAYNKRLAVLFFETVPYSVTGFSLGFYKIVSYLQNFKTKTFTLSYLVYILVTRYNIFSNLKGVGYQGIYLNIKSVCIIFVFSLFPSANIKNKYIIKLLNLLTNHTGGVYYLHVSIHSYCINFFDSIKYRTFFGMIINYIICYFICFLGIIIFGKTPIKYLFC